MRKILVSGIAFVLVAIGAPAAAAQQATPTAGWREVYNRPTPDITDIDMFDGQRGLALGLQAILRTEDGGLTWTEPEIQDSWTFGDIGWIDADSAWVAAATGTILRTDDGARTWARQTSGTQVHLQHIAVVSDAEAWITGNGWGFSDVGPSETPPSVLLHTMDGGATWNAGPRFSDFAAFGPLSFVGRQGWVAASRCAPGTPWQSCDKIGGAGLLHTADGGQNWNIQSAHTGFDMSTLQFVDSEVGFATGPWETPRGQTERSLFKTVDAGRTWERVVQSPNGSTNVLFTDREHGWVSAVDETVETLDGGATWNRLPGVPQLGAFDAAGGKLVFASYAGPVLGVYEGGGVVASQTPLQRPIHTAQFQSDSVGYTGNGLKTTDGGRSWSPLRTPVRLEGFVSAGEAVIWATDPSCYPTCDPPLYRSLDGGLTWEPIGAPFPYVVELDVLSAQRAWVTSEGGLWRTNDGGYSWQPVEPGPPFMADYHFVDAQFGWRQTYTCDLEACLRVTHDGGASWQEFALPSGAYVYQFVSATTGFAVRSVVSGDTGICCDVTLLRTTNGGRTWSETPSMRSLMSVYFSSPTRGWALSASEDGSANEIIGTHDGGQTWRVEATGAPYGSFVAAGRSVWLVSFSGGVIAEGRAILWRGNVEGSITAPDTGTGSARTHRSRDTLALAALTLGLTALAGSACLARRRR